MAVVHFWRPSYKKNIYASRDAYIRKFHFRFRFSPFLIADTTTTLGHYTSGNSESLAETWFFQVCVNSGMYPQLYQQLILAPVNLVPVVTLSST